MPLRSVEAATRDDAIAAAREQFGLSVRVVGVRRVRSGGVLGFFATERYVAEVDPDPATRPAVPVPAPRTGERRAAQDPVRESARASARDAAREWTRGASDAAGEGRSVPARNAAAAWAAEARVTAPRPAAPADEERVTELAGLLGGSPPPAPYAPASSTRPTRTPEPEQRPAVVRTPVARPAWSELLAGTASPPAPAQAPAPVQAAPVQAPEPPAAPSPFTAALARMVAGDRDVQQAVEDALTGAAEERSPGPPAPRSTWPEPERAAETSVPSPVAHQEEEPVELQDWTPSSPPVVDSPETWTPAPEPVAPLDEREESIAEVLRDALAQGRSDEALAGILRTIMDGASSSAAPADPPAPAVAPLVLETVAVPEPSTLAAVEPVLPEPVAAPVRSGSDLGWDGPTSSSLWAETVAPSTPTPPAAEELPVTEASVEVGAEQAAAGETLHQEATEAVAVEAVVTEEVVTEEVVTEEVVTEEVVTEAVVTEAAVTEEVVTEEVVVEDSSVEMGGDLPVLLSPVLARTASDPAPMSLDATTVMPPLSLLPPLPSRQRGGRPPVPPSAARASAAAARPAATAPATEEPPPSGRSESLATVTRLPLAPVAEPTAPAVEPPATEAPAASGPASSGELVVETPASPVADVAGSDTSVLPALAAPRASRPTAERPRAAAPAGPAAVEAPLLRGERAPRPAEPVLRPAGPAPAGVLDRLADLGLAEELLDAPFTADLAARGTYAALTRMLADRLPEAPEAPAGAGDVLVVVGPGVETLRAARALAASLRLDPDRVQWATRGDLAGLAPAGSRMTTIETAIERRHDAVGSGTLTIVAVDAPLRADAYWTAQMLAIWSPAAVWAVVEATRKPEDLGPWIEVLPRVDALVVQDTDLSADPAAVLHRVALPLGLPVAVVDGVRATPHRWASLLCERLETPPA